MYRSGRLWKIAEGELSRLNLREAIYSLPPDASNVEVIDLGNRVFDVKGVTESGYFEPMTCLTSQMDCHEASIGQDLKRNFDSLSNEFDVEIVVTQDAVYSRDQKRSTKGSLFVHLLGLSSHVSAADAHLASLIELYEDSKSGAVPRFVECFDLEASSLLPQVIGVDMANLRHVLSTYKTQVRVPSLILPYKDRKAQIHLSGEIHSLVLSAKDALMEVMERSQSSVYYFKLSNVSPGKLSFIKNYYPSEMARLMIKYRSFIRVTDSCIEFQSPCLTLLNSVVKVFTINVLHQIVEVQITLHSDFAFTDDMIRLIVSNEKGGPLNAMKITDHEDQLLLIGNLSTVHDNLAANKKNSDIIYHLAMILRALPPNSLKQLRAVFELHSDYEEFISGKKNGKVTRIMESAPCLIELEKLEEDDNLFLVLIADSLSEFSNTFAMVINELPAEESFFVPEVYHRPVIGAGGSIIQATMKRYNVFVRFSNSFFLPQNDLSHARYDNVIIRCPFKNVSTISEAKRELNLLAREYGDLQPRTFIKFSPGQYRFMLSTSFHKGAQIIGEIEKTYNVYVIFPFEEPPENYLLEIRGNADNSMQAAKELVKTCFGIERELKVNKPISLTSDVYNSIITPFKQNMKIEATFSENTVRLTYEQGNSSVTSAMDLLTNFLEKRNLRILSKDVIVDFIISNNHDTYDPSFNSDGSTSGMNSNFEVGEYYQPMLSSGAIGGKNRLPQVQARRFANVQNSLNARNADYNLAKHPYPVYNQQQFPNA